MLNEYMKKKERMKEKKKERKNDFKDSSSLTIAKELL